MRKSIAFSIMVLILTLPMVVFGQGGDAETFIRGVGSDITTFNPLLAADGGSYNAIELIFPTPFDIDPQSGLPVPGLTSWEISDDSLTYTFHINEKAFWSDGTPITSQDFKFTYEAVVSDQVTSRHSSSAALFESVNIIDERTFELKMTRPNCRVWNDLYALRVLPSHRFAPDFSDIMDNPLNSFADISGGPYLLEEWRPDEFHRYSANPYYWGGEPSIKHVIQRVIADPAVANQALVAGEIDYMGLNPAQFEQLPPSDTFTVTPIPTTSSYITMMNWSDPTQPTPAYDTDGNLNNQPPHPILADRRVRQAIAMGYNKDDILATLPEGAAQRQVANVSPNLSWAFNEELAPWPYDPQGAAAILDEAGWTDEDGDGIRECHGCMNAEDGTPLALRVSFSSADPLWETIAVVMQDHLTDIGFDVTLENLETGTLISERVLAQSFDVVIITFGGLIPPDPTSKEPLLLSRGDIPGTGGASSYVNPEFDQLSAEGRTVPGCAPEDRAPIYKRIQEIIYNDVAVEFTISPSTFIIMNNRVGNFNSGPFWFFPYAIDELTLSN